MSYPPFDFYLGWQQLEAASGPRGSRVAYAGTNIPYYLFGKDLRNEVRYVNVDRHRDWLLHDYHRQAIEDRGRDLAQPAAGLGSECAGLHGLACETWMRREFSFWS